MKVLIWALAGAMVLASPATAQTGATVSAANPAGLVKALADAGYAPKLSKDSYGDPQIEFELDDYKTTVLFYGCDEKTHTGCDSVQLRAGFDRDTPWTAEAALAVAKKYRFVSIWLDDDGDPWVQWDILTGEGLPAALFLEAVSSFGDSLTDTAEIVFAGD